MGNISSWNWEAELSELHWAGLFSFQFAHQSHQIWWNKQARRAPRHDSECSQITTLATEAIIQGFLKSSHHSGDKIWILNWHLKWQPSWHQSHSTCVSSPGVICTRNPSQTGTWELAEGLEKKKRWQEFLLCPHRNRAESTISSCENWILFQRGHFFPIWSSQSSATFLLRWQFSCNPVCLHFLGYICLHAQWVQDPLETSFLVFPPALPWVKNLD